MFSEESLELFLVNGHNLNKAIAMVENLKSTGMLEETGLKSSQCEDDSFRLFYGNVQGR